MRKSIGAALIFAASMWTAYLLVSRREKQRKDILALQEGLLYLKRELAERMAPLSECFALLSRQEKRNSVGEFYRQLLSGMSELGAERFSAVWNKAVREKLTFLAEWEAERIGSLGTVLEGSDASALCEALDNAEKDLAHSAFRLEEKRKESTRLAFCVSFSSGAFFIIMLI